MSPADASSHAPTPEEMVTVGRIRGAWGTRGALRVQPTTSFPQRFSRGAELLLEGQPLRILHVHHSRGDVVVQVSGIATRDQAEALRGKEFQVPASTLAPLPEGEYYHLQLLDMEVWTTQGEHLGRVAEILVTGSNDVLVVRHQGREVLIPAIEEVVLEVDVPGKRMTVDLPPGLR